MCMHHAKVSPRQANCTENAYDYFAMNNKTGVEDRKQTKKNTHNKHWKTL